MKYILYMWQLPQNLLGLILLLFYRNKYKLTSIDDIDLYVADKMRGAISLGKYIILSKYDINDKVTHMHEYGHTIQSKYLGPLYLFVIGVPSILNAIFGFTKYYYDFYTESWADELGGIERNEFNRRFLK